MTEPKTPRRRSLLKGAAVAAGAMSAPMVAVAQTTSLPLPEHLAGQGHLPRVRATTSPRRSTTWPAAA